MRLDARVCHEVVLTPRVKQVCGIFDLSGDYKNERSWSCDLPLEERDWKIGLIVGPSGCGKTTVARALFGDAVLQATDLKWPTDLSVVDAFPSSLSVSEIVELLCSVGFSSPPHWLRPYSTLSLGEQFRVSLARLLAERRELTVCDEYTSVVDRTVARVASVALAKTVRKLGLRFVACTCHEDVEEWLQPDWVFRPAEMRFHWRCLQRRPVIHLEVIRCRREAWELFRQYHYMSGNLHVAAKCFLALWEGRPVCFSAWLHEHRNYSSAASGGGKNAAKIREHRTVCLPDYQGVGIGVSVSSWCAALFRGAGYKVVSRTSHPAMVASRMNDDRWRFRSRKLTTRYRNSFAVHFFNYSGVRGVYDFEYVGPSLPMRNARMLLV
ncbi:MAG: hypothetical protein KatS3mg105_5011 [Gemmatales bacterium]|nr:MAG: hypothetical protein KatS3mg105_5011 [Gemmatales bacterium]